MFHFNATKAKTHFGELLDSARQEPITIDRNGRSVAVMLSTEEYQRLQDIEDIYLLIIANKAKNEGFLTEVESESLLKDMLNA